jgi:hypothetical protein
VFLQGKKKIHGRKREREDEADSKCFHSAGFSLKTTTVKNGFDAKNV